VTVLSTDDVGITADALGKLQGSQLSDEEYLYAIRPWLLRTVLDSGAVTALFVADDVHVLGSLQSVVDMAIARGAGFVRRSPVLQPSSAATLSQGSEEPAIELDLLAVGTTGAAFLSRWQEESLRGATVPGLSANEFVDRAADEFAEAIIAEPRFNLGWWNLSLLNEARSAEAPALEAPVAALHLHGFDALRPHLIAADEEPRLPLRLSERPWLADLCGQYAQRVLKAGSESGPSVNGEVADTPPSVRLPLADGSTARIGEDRFIAECWKRARREADIGRRPAPPDPTVVRHEELISWLNSPCDGSSPQVSRYLMEVYRSRPDLQLAFPDLAREPEPFLRWAATHGRRELGIPEELILTSGHLARRVVGHFAARPATSRGPALGVNVVGLLGTHLGLGEAARRLLSALGKAGIPYRTHEVMVGSAPRLRRPAPTGSLGQWFPINIICLNPPELLAFRHDMGRAMWDLRYTSRRYNIGVWVWETETVPESWREAASLVDEVWVPSDYVRTVFSQAIALPIITIPYAVPVPYHPGYMDRRYLGLPDRFTFLFMFDFFSSMWRKNALGLVAAFQRAFSPHEGPRLVIKTLNGDRHPGDFEELLLAVGGREDIVVHDRVLTVDEQAALLDACDCYVSLHRAEGFGLTMAEAMALGKPVIATGYSGNLAYMTPQNSYLVGYRRVPVGVDWDRYPISHIWAEPDSAEAASLLRLVWTDRSAAHDRGEMARADVERGYSPAAVGNLVRQRLEEIWGSHKFSEGSRRAQRLRYPREVIRALGRQVLLESRHRRWR
jgi:glycosyltransferase involved in cell wall biosynthesis